MRQSIIKIIKKCTRKVCLIRKFEQHSISRYTKIKIYITNYLSDVKYS